MGLTTASLSRLSGSNQSEILMNYYRQRRPRREEKKELRKRSKQNYPDKKSLSEF